VEPFVTSSNGKEQKTVMNIYSRKRSEGREKEEGKKQWKVAQIKINDKEGGGGTGQEKLLWSRGTKNRNKRKNFY